MQSNKLLRHLCNTKKMNNKTESRGAIINRKRNENIMTKIDQIILKAICRSGNNLYVKELEEKPV
jgi:hypothetical protein